MASSIIEALSVNYTTGRFVLMVAVLTLIICLIGCHVITVDTMNNEPLPAESKPPPTPTRAKETITQAELPNGIFVGIALSGGGSRAANFSSAVLFELERLKILGKENKNRGHFIRIGRLAAGGLLRAEWSRSESLESRRST